MPILYTFIVTLFWSPSTVTVTNRYCITALERGEEDRKRLEVYNFKEGLEVSGSAGRYFDSWGVFDRRLPLPENIYYTGRDTLRGIPKTVTTLLLQDRHI